MLADQSSTISLTDVSPKLGLDGQPSGWRESLTDTMTTGHQDDFPVRLLSVWQARWHVASVVIMHDRQLTCWPSCARSCLPDDWR